MTSNHHQRDYLLLACCVTGQFALPNASGTGKDPWITTATCHTWEIRETGLPEMNSDWSAVTKMEVMFVVLPNFSEEFASHSQHRHADIVPMIPMSRPNVRAHRRGFVTACQACETYFSVKCDHSWGGPIRGERDQFLAVEFWHVNDSGLCASHLMILLSRWLLRHDTLCIWKSKTKKNILNHNWYDVLFKK